MSEVFLTFVITTASGLFLAMLGVCYKSRCTRIDFCGVSIERNAVLEERLDEFALRGASNSPRIHQPNPSFHLPAS